MIATCFVIHVPAFAIDSMAEAFADQADLCMNRGEFGHAADLYLQAIQHEVKDPNDELDWARLHNQLGRCYLKMNKSEAQRKAFYAAGREMLNEKQCLECAEAEIMEALKLKELRGNDATDFIYIAESLEALAKVSFDQNILPKSEGLYRRALRIRESKEGKECRNCGTSYEGLGDVLLNTKLYKDSERHYMTALRIYKRDAARNGLKIAMCEHSLAIMYYRWSKWSSAGKYYDFAVAGYKRLLPNAEAARLLKNLRDQELADFPEAAYGQAREELKEFLGKSKRPAATLCALLRNMIAAAKRYGKYDDAKKLQDMLKRSGC